MLFYELNLDSKYNDINQERHRFNKTFVNRQID